MAPIDPELWQDFISEADEHLENIEGSIMRWEAEPENREIIHDLFRAFHSLKGLAGFVEQSMIQQLAHETETLLHRCRDGNLTVCREIANLMLRSRDLIAAVCTNPALVDDAQFASAIDQQSVSLQIAANGGLPAQAEGTKAPCREAPANVPGPVAGPAPTDNGFVRIPANKVDNLVDLLGELLVIQSQVEQSLLTQSGISVELMNSVNSMARISREIQNVSMSMRMVSLKSTFQKVVRIARDATDELGKQVQIVTQGEETEIDRSVADKLIDPLLHLVKNCISHGIEQEEVRLQQGKAASGNVQVRAYSKRGSVYVTVSDDGRGIDLQRVLQKAMEQGLADPVSKYSQEEIIRFLFQPGFSTKETVDNVSGRGVGLDVVQAELRKLGGRVEVRSSPGLGTEFVLKIPINLAVTNGTIVSIASEHYILPTLFIKRIVSMDQSMQSASWVKVHGRFSAVSLKGEVIPLAVVPKLYPESLGDSADQYRVVVVLELEQGQRALPVEAIVGKREVAVKPLGTEFAGVEVLAGASILGNGRVALLLDVESLFRMGDEE